MSDLTTPCSVKWPDAHLLIFPILSRNPMGFDTCKLLHKQQQNLILRQKAEASVGVSPAQIVAFQTRNASHATQSLSSCKKSEHHRSLWATCGATTPLRARAFGGKSPRGNSPLGDESLLARRLTLRTREEAQEKAKEGCKDRSGREPKRAKKEMKKEVRAEAKEIEKAIEEA